MLLYNIASGEIMRTQKINFFTICTNYLTKTGRQANIEIADMQGAVYQKRLPNGHIALLNEHKAGDTFMLIKKDGSVGIKESTKKENGTNKLITIAKTFYEKSSQKIKEVKKEVLYSLPENRIEEIARKTSNIDGSSELKVISAADRKTPFHQTRLAGSLHPAMAEKTITQNGDRVYIERYPQT